MAEVRAQRRLAAILAADVVGYSRLMETDEAGTLAALKSRRKNALDPLVAKHQGRIFKTTGDGVLVEFASAVNAVQCAVDLQQGIATANSGESEDRHIILRIGVNLGDIMAEGSDLYGDGVNIAARLEALAEPGGILVSGTTHDYVRNKVTVGFDDLGAQTLKNIAEPVRAYRVTGTPVVAAASPKATTDKPSIAILPFTNMSGDPEQDYFSNGITEDIITELSRYRSLLVIARNSSFQFCGPSVDLAAVRRKLGVQFVVEGSIRKIGSRLRLAVQLVDAVTESHVWAERYDRELEDIFDVQDDMTRAIAATLEGRVAASGAERAKRKLTQEWAVYDYFLQGREQFHRFKFAEAEPFFARAVELDPSYAQAYAYRALALIGKYWNDLKAETKQEALDCATKALSLDDTDAWCQSTMGFVLTHREQRDLAGPYFDRAIALNPSDVQIAYMRAWWLARVGAPMRPWKVWT
jgi:TolB-like protein